MKKSAEKIILFGLICAAWTGAADFASCTTPTHTSPKPSSLISGDGYQLAKTWFLPDWQADTRSYNTNFDNDIDNDNSGGDIEKNCETYGFASPGSVDLSLYDCSDYDLKPLYGLECYTGCSCKSKFQYNTSNCDIADGYVLSGSSCGGKYETCACRAEFQYTSSNCSGEYRPAGESCGGKYNKCEGRPCSDGGFYDSEQPNMKCSAKSYGGKSCYDCYVPDCSEGGLETAAKTGYICETKEYYGKTCYSCMVDPCYNLVSKSCPYGCEKTYDQCPDKCESCYADNCRNRNGLSCQYGCQSYYTDCASKCEYCRACSNACEEGYSLTACSGSGQTTADTKVNQCGNTCYKCQCQAGYVDLETCGWLTIFIR